MSARSSVQLLDDASLLVFFDERRYLVNCGEGTQRACAQHAVRLARVSCVALTRLAPWRTHVGGLPGLLSTLGDAALPADVVLAGPPHTARFVGALRAFLRRTALALAVHEHPLLGQGDDDGAPRVLFNDGHVNIRAVSVGPPNTVCAPSAKRPRAPAVSENCEVAVSPTRNEFVVRMFKVEGSSVPSSPVRMDDAGAAGSNNSECDDCSHSASSGDESKSNSSNHSDSTVSGGKASSGIDHDNTARSAVKTHLPREGDGHMRDAARMPPVEGTYRQALCLALEGPAVPGRFDAARARALGVPAGPLCGRLIRGEAVALPDGRTVLPAQCVSPALPGATLLVLDVPPEALFGGAGAELSRRLSLLCAGRRATLAVHLGARELLLSREYCVHVLGALPKNVQHVLRPSAALLDIAASVPLPSHCALVASLGCPLESDSQGHGSVRDDSPSDCFEVQSHSQCGDGRRVERPSDIFEVQPDSKRNGSMQDDDPYSSFEEAAGFKVTVGLPLDSIQWSPQCENITARGEASLPSAIPVTIDLSEEDREAARACFSNGDYAPTPEMPALTLLGTGAAVPGKYRNVSSTLLDYGDAALLLDCGEDTLRQVVRRFGPMASDVLARLRVVLVSHLHADHQLGVPGVLAALPPGTVLVAPSRYLLFLDEYAECTSDGCLLDRVRFVSAESLVDAAQLVSGGSRHTNIAVRAVPVVHCPLAYGYVVNMDSGGAASVVYSGDTRPCEALAIAGRGAAVLVHEATFCDALAAEAVARRHCTASEAHAVHAAMASKLLLATHVSQRYAKAVLPMGPEMAADATVVPAALDLMTVHVGREAHARRVVDVFSRLCAASEPCDDES